MDAFYCSPSLPVPSFPSLTYSPCTSSTRIGLGFSLPPITDGESEGSLSRDIFNLCEAFLFGDSAGPALEDVPIASVDNRSSAADSMASVYGLVPLGNISTESISPPLSPQTRLSLARAELIPQLPETRSPQFLLVLTCPSPDVDLPTAAPREEVELRHRAWKPPGGSTLKLELTVEEHPNPSVSSSDAAEEDDADENFNRALEHAAMAVLNHRRTLRMSENEVYRAQMEDGERRKERGKWGKVLGAVGLGKKRQ